MARHDPRKGYTQEMAELAKKKLHSKIPQLELALEGRLEEHHPAAA